MKKTVEKIAIIAHICITFLFVLLACLILFNALEMKFDENGRIVVDSIVIVILSVLAAVYVGLSAYLLYVTFSDRNIVHEVLLYSDKDNATKASSRVIKDIAVKNAKQLKEIQVRRIKIYPDEKFGFKLSITANIINSNNVELTQEKLRRLLVANYRDELGLQFSAIDINISKNKSNYKPNVSLAEQEAKKVVEERKQEATKKIATQQAKAKLADDAIATTTPSDKEQNKKVADSDKDGNAETITDDKTQNE